MTQRFDGTNGDDTWAFGYILVAPYLQRGILYGSLAGSAPIQVNDSALIFDGGIGNDRMLVAGTPASVLSIAFYGGDGNDYLTAVFDGIPASRVMPSPGGPAFLEAFGGAGNDTFIGGVGVAHFSGGAGDDRVIGGFTSDLLSGDEGNDIIWGRSFDLETSPNYQASDTIFGGSGDDLIRAGEGSDTLAGDDGNDVIYGNIGNDKITGGDGNDILFGGLNGGLNRSGQLEIDGGDQVSGGAGDDILIGEAGNDVLWGDDGNDQLMAVRGMT